MLHEEVDVVGHHLKGDDLPAAFVSLLPDQFVQAFRDPAAEDRTTVLRAPHDVESEVIHAAGESANLPGHDHAITIHAPQV